MKDDAFLLVKRIYGSETYQGSLKKGAEPTERQYLEEKQFSDLEGIIDGNNEKLKAVFQNGEFESYTLDDFSNDLSDLITDGTPCFLDDNFTLGTARLVKLASFLRNGMGVESLVDLVREYHGTNLSDHPTELSGFLEDKKDFLELSPKLRPYGSFYQRNKNPEKIDLPNQKIKADHKLIRTLFWDKTLDMAASLKASYNAGYAGAELAFDLASFIPQKALPYEFSKGYIEKIKQFVENTGFEIYIHNPIIGFGYKREDCLLFDPMDYVQLQKDVLSFASGVSAQAVTMHVIHPDDNIEKYAELIAWMKQEGLETRLSLENYYYTDYEDETNPGKKVYYSSEQYLGFIQEVIQKLKTEHEFNDNDIKKYLGITFDTGHANLSDENVMDYAYTVSKFAAENDLNVHLHATTNFGSREVSKYWGEDCHERASIPGIPNQEIIALFRAMNTSRFSYPVVEQIDPLNQEDKEYVNAIFESEEIKYKTCVDRGNFRLRLLDLSSDCLNLSEPELFILGFDFRPDKAYQRFAEYMLFSRYLYKKKDKKTSSEQMNRIFGNIKDLMGSPTWSLIGKADERIQYQTIKTNLKKRTDQYLTAIKQDLDEKVLEKREKEFHNGLDSDRITQLGNIETFTPGEELFTAGRQVIQKDRKLYYILEGYVEILSPEKKQVTTVGPDSLIGELSLLFGTSPTNTVRVIKEETNSSCKPNSDIKVIEITYENLEKKLKNERDGGNNDISAHEFLYMDLSSKFEDILERYGELYQQCQRLNKIGFYEFPEVPENGIILKPENNLPELQLNLEPEKGSKKDTPIAEKGDCANVMYFSDKPLDIIDESGELIAQRDPFTILGELAFARCLKGRENNRTATIRTTEDNTKIYKISKDCYESNKQKLLPHICYALYSRLYETVNLVQGIED
ncbi:cyclic nucleotide-binding domain-containing protein [Candidatus Woesearchaeota archaeon]|nr:cyclic nucleotide-binding domain-containing protein [Candidatus Woesearchaeota archaeon]